MTTATAPPQQKPKEPFNPDDFRMTIGEHLEEQRKRLMSRQITEYINAHEYARAERVLLDLESQFPGDTHAVGCRRDLEAARRDQVLQIADGNRAARRSKTFEIRGA